MPSPLTPSGASETLRQWLRELTQLNGTPQDLLDWLRTRLRLELASMQPTPADGDSLLSFPLAEGTLVVGAEREQFPNEVESAVLELVAARLTLARQAEQARERERAATLIMDEIPNLVSLLGADGTPQLINRQILQYTGKSEEELKGWGGSDLVHPDDREGAKATFRRNIPAGTPFDIVYRMLGADGNYRWFHARHRPLKRTDGSTFQWCVSVSDIDERVRAEEVLRENERRSRSVLDGIPGLVATLTPRGEVEAVNRQIVEYTGAPLAELKKWGENGIVNPDDLPHVVEIFSRSIASGIPYEIEQRLRRHDGSYRWFSNRGTPDLDAAGNIVRWYVLLIDIHESKQAEQALAELRNELARMARISSLSVLTASVAHEVSQPLSGIITNASTCTRMLGASPPNVEGAVEMMRRISRDGVRASEVVSRLRALFAKRSDNNEDVDLNEAAAEVIALAIGDLKRSGAVVRAAYAPGLPRIHADRVQLQQVMFNLLLNAADAMNTVHDQPRMITIVTARQGDSVTFSVRDVGVGVADKDIERLFDAFYTTKSRGMGIGLSVSRSIIESHKGRLWGEANDGPGATFAFSIPLKA